MAGYGKEGEEKVVGVLPYLAHMRRELLKINKGRVTQYSHQTSYHFPDKCLQLLSVFHSE